MLGLPVDGVPDQDVLGQLSSPDNVFVRYQINESDAENVTGLLSPYPRDCNTAERFTRRDDDDLLFNSELSGRDCSRSSSI